MPQPSYQPGKPSVEMARFTNRDPERAIFARFLNLPAGDLPRLPAVMFYGVGGIGKSWLLRHLQNQLSHAWAGVPSVRIDFTKEGASNRFRDDTMATLAEIRNIAKDSPCPRFDLAYAFLQVRRGVQEESALAHGGRKTAWLAANEIIKAGLTAVPGAGPGLFLGWSLLEKMYPKIKRKTGLEKAAQVLQQDVQPLHDLPLEEIEKTLVWRLAEDLKQDEILPLRTYKAVQAVVFIDTLEALEPLNSSLSSLEIGSRWLRDLICLLNDRVLFVLAGQNRLQWDAFDADWADNAWLEQHLVNGLSERDARDFLNRCEITEPSIQQAILSRCLAAGGGYHSFHLGLLADLAWVERYVNRRPLTKELFLSLPAGDWNKLALRFLKALEDRADADWVRKLALTPEFDEEAARAAHSLHRSQEQDTDWHMLQSFSFVIRGENGAGWQTIHSAMQRAIREDAEHDAEGTRAAHEWWREYWRKRTTGPHDQFAPLAWYHLWELNPREATEQWAKLAKTARLEQPLDMPFHYHLLSWWQPVELLEEVWSDEAQAFASQCFAEECFWASLGDRTKNLETAIALCAKALRVWTRETFSQDWATAQNNLGNACRNLPTGDLGKNLRQAIACYREALEVWTREAFPQDWAMVQNNLGRAYQNLPRGDRGENICQAIACYQLALEGQDARGITARLGDDPEQLGSCIFGPANGRSW